MKTIFEIGWVTILQCHITLIDSNNRIYRGLLMVWLVSNNNNYDKVLICLTMYYMYYVLTMYYILLHRKNIIN